MTTPLEVLDGKFDQMILASYPNVMLGEDQRRALRFAFFGGIQVAFTALYTEAISPEQLQNALEAFIEGVKVDHGITQQPKP